MGTLISQNIPYSGTTLSQQSLPIGFMGFMQGTTVPSGFLPCDGSVFSIALYPELADYYLAEYGSKNHFGGDGITTFATPDMRGEFPRGAGTNSHTNQGNGGSVGQHQDGTRHTTTVLDTNVVFAYNDVSSWRLPVNTDSISNAVGAYKGARISTTIESSNIGTYTSRPTNTSWLFIVKAKSDRLDRITFCEINDQSSAGDVVWSGEKLTAILNTLCAPNAGAHNGIYRGKCLGTEVTAEQYAAIAAGTFDGMYIGDYWTINGVNWRIAGFDYWLGCGDQDSGCTDHHVVIVPDTCIVNNVKMNNTNIVTGAYVGSDFHTGNNGNTGFATAKSIINAAFGSTHILNHREYLANAATNGYESAGAWYDSTVELMTEQMVYGGKIFTNCIQGTNWAAGYTIGKSQLPLFALEPSRICNRADWWLRGVAHSTLFAHVNANGNASANNASTAYGVRPAFGIYKPAA